MDEIGSYSWWVEKGPWALFLLLLVPNLIRGFSKVQAKRERDAERWQGARGAAEGLGLRYEGTVSRQSRAEEPELFETSDLTLRERLKREVRQRRATPETERLPQRSRPRFA